MQRNPPPLVIPATDGYPLGASLTAGGDASSRVVLIAPATGVRRRIYQPFAEFLAGAGHSVITWDWRGTGDSRPPSLRGFPATMRDWAERDLAGVVEWARARHPGAQLTIIGHSFGGQAVGLAAAARDADALVTIAAQSGYLGHWPPARRAIYAGLWYVAVPLLTRAFGYFPAYLLGLGEDLPKDVALQWARWCRTPSYLGDWSGHRRVTAPMLAVSFADDPYATFESVEALHREFRSARIERRHVTPQAVGARAVGHFGFFRPGVTPALWWETVEWLDRVLGRGR